MKRLLFCDNQLTKKNRIRIFVNLGAISNYPLTHEESAIALENYYRSIFRHYLRFLFRKVGMEQVYNRLD